MHLENCMKLRMPGASGILHNLLDHVYVNTLVNHMIHLQRPTVLTMLHCVLKNVFRICTTVIYFVRNDINKSNDDSNSV